MLQRVAIVVVVVLDFGSAACLRLRPYSPTGALGLIKR
jgi:hypothetical protein